ncbi:hypothetical protein CA267_005250 [Alteromonas pelagimontana]|uniref:Uncharacterized protein n=1 Tax=Alteromonas pelagimontana TaxID=1858656 RepID=A0A6M4MAN2_9ALTE|nr:hypothetical protein [Alteromonas pelagimontana]QJR80222.1 hypothetical protein CA267_005250 [Alteromonas pelagimontana]
MEASGFGASSYPIEIGVKRSDGERFCMLIKPYDDWKHWDNSAEALHGISREHLLRFGSDGGVVCDRLNGFLNAQTAYSDGWVVDNPWLIQLFARAGRMMTFRLSALEHVLSEAQMKSWHKVKSDLYSRQSRSRHRASVDAELIQQTFLQTSLASS